LTVPKAVRPGELGSQKQLETGRVSINGASHEPLAPFGGFQQSGLGRELGVFGLEALLETKAGAT